VVTIEIAKAARTARADQHLRWGVDANGREGNVYVMVVATRTDGNAKAARSEAAAAARRIALLNAARV
jgi:hypothetical protein